MQDVAVVTTFARDHISLYGNQFVNSYKKYWSAPLYLFAEDFTQQDLNTPTEVLDYYAHIPEQLKFKNHIIDQSLGLDSKPANRLKKALRWSYKSFVIWYALKNIDCKYLVWLDADVETLLPVPKDLIQRINTNRLLSAYPQTIDGELHIESGFVIFNKQHALTPSLIDHYAQGYIDHKVLELNKPWDGFWLGKFLSNSNHEQSSNLIRIPFSNVKNILHHHVGKDKFHDTGLNKYSGRN